MEQRLEETAKVVQALEDKIRHLEFQHHKVAQTTYSILDALRGFFHYLCPLRGNADCPAERFKEEEAKPRAEVCQ
jgi:hypothetical protein